MKSNYPTQRKRIVFHAINGVGLGHINRSLVLAKAIQDMDNSIDIFFITNTKYPEIIRGHGLPCLQIKSGLKKIAPNELAKIKKIINNKSVKVIVYDTHFSHEFISCVENKNTKNVLVLRKLKNSYLKEFIKDNYKKFDLILLPHTRSEFADYSIDKQLLKKIDRLPKMKFIGPIVNNDFDSNDNHNKKKFKILVTCGGGGQDKNNTGVNEYLSLIHNAFNKMGKKIKNLELIVVTGPLYNGYFKIKNAKIIKYHKNLIGLMKSVDLCISTAGYNSCNEIIISKVPAILVPLPRFHESQLERSKRLKSYGVAEIIENFSEKKLAIVIQDLYSNIRKRQEMNNNYTKIKLEPGNKRGAQEILGLLIDKTIRLKTGETCNNNCIYCEFLDIKSIRNKSFESIKKELEKLKEEGCTKVIFPCNTDIREDFIDIIKLASELSLKIELDTNGRMFFYNSLTREIKDYEAYIDCINVFINGTKDQHNEISRTISFQQSVGGLKKLINTGINIAVKIVITELNYRSLSQLILKINELGIKKIRIVYPIAKAGNKNIPEVINSYQYINRAINEAKKHKIKILPGNFYFNPYISSALNLDENTAVELYSKKSAVADKSIENKNIAHSSFKELIVSIIVPTYNRKKILELTLLSLIHQNFPKSKYEIIVVDDGSTDCTESMVKKLKPECKFKYIYWPREKPYKFGEAGNRAGLARNIGVKHAEGDLLLFWDSDMIATPNMLLEHIKAFKKNYSFLGIRKNTKKGALKRNKVISDFKNNCFKIAKSEIGTNTQIDQELAQLSYDVYKHKYPWYFYMTYNLMVERKIFNELGGFDENFVYWGDEDQEFGYRLLKAGYKFKVNKRVIGYHQYHKIEPISKKFFFEHKYIHKNIFYKKHLDKDIAKFYKYFLKITDN